MTTEVLQVVSPDLYTDNDSLLLDRNQAETILHSPPSLAAISFVAKNEQSIGKLQDLCRACGIKAASFVSGLSADYQCWLFVADGPWREASPVVRHRRLWKNHRSLSDSLVEGTRSAEVEIMIGNKVRYAGLAEVTPELTDQAFEIARTDRACAIIFSRRGDITNAFSVESIFRIAFPCVSGEGATHVDWLALAVSLCPLGDILMRMSGQFDDRDAAADLIATPGNLGLPWKS